MPNPSTPTRSIWVKHLLNHITPTKNTIFIAHSIGCMCLLRYLEKIDKKVGGAILVAPYTENEKKYKTISSFFYGELDKEKIKKNCKNIYTIYSSDDPYVSTWQCFKMKELLDTTYLILDKRGHFDAEDGIKEIPEILDILKKNFSL